MFYMLEDDSFLLPFSYVNLLIDVTCQGPSHRSLPCDRCWGDYRSHHTGSAEGKSRCLWRWCWPIRGRAAADWWDPFEAPQSRDFPLKIFEISQGCDIKTDSNVLISFFITARFAEKGWNKAHFFPESFRRTALQGKEKGQVELLFSFLLNICPTLQKMYRRLGSNLLCLPVRWFDHGTNMWVSELHDSPAVHTYSPAF